MHVSRGDAASELWSRHSIWSNVSLQAATSLFSSSFIVFVQLHLPHVVFSHVSKEENSLFSREKRTKKKMFDIVTSLELTEYFIKWFDKYVTFSVSKELDILCFQQRFMGLPVRLHTCGRKDSLSWNPVLESYHLRPVMWLERMVIPRDIAVSLKVSSTTIAFEESEWPLLVILRSVIFLFRQDLAFTQVLLVGRHLVSVS